MIRSRFISLFAALIFIATGCAGIEKRNSDAGVTPSGRNEQAVKSAPRMEKYSERPATVVKHPSTFNPPAAEKIILNDDNIKVYLYARGFAQGNAAYFEIVNKEVKLNKIEKISFGGDSVPFTKTDWGYRGIFAIDPEAKTGKIFFTVVYGTDSGEKKLEGAVNVKDVQFPVAETLLDLGKFSDKEYTSSPEFEKLIKESEEARKKAFSSETEDCIGNVLCHPRDFHKITGDYWKKRIYAAYKKKGKRKVKVKGHESYHRGLDLKGSLGDPVYAMADGKIVLARKMFYEGNMIVVDHGNRVFSYYMHMDSLVAHEGDSVHAGDQIGRVGSTGTSTAPHLHVALYIRGVHVNPLSLLSLPVSR